MTDVVYSDRLESIINPPYTPFDLGGVDGLFEPADDDFLLRRLLVARAELIYKAKVLVYIGRYYPPGTGKITVTPAGGTFAKRAYQDSSVSLSKSMSVLRGMIEELILLRMKLSRLTLSKQGIKKALELQKEAGVDEHRPTLEETDLERCIGMLRLYNKNVQHLNYVSEHVFKTRVRLHVLEDGGHSAIRSLNPTADLHVSTLFSEVSHDLREVDDTAQGRSVFSCKFIRIQCARDGLYNIIYRFMHYNHLMSSFYRSYEFSRTFECNMCRCPIVVDYKDRDVFIPQRLRWVECIIPSRVDPIFGMLRILRYRTVKREARIREIDNAITQGEHRYSAVLTRIREHIDDFRIQWDLFVGDGKWLDTYVLRGPLRESYADITTNILSVF